MPLKAEASVVFRNASQQLKTILASKNLWMALLFIALFYFSPGFSTPLFYRQTDELHFSKQAIGNLGVFGSAFAILAAILYSQLIKRLNIRIMILIGVADGGRRNAAFSLLFELESGGADRISEWAFFWVCGSRSDRSRGASNA